MPEEFSLEGPNCGGNIRRTDSGKSLLPQEAADGTPENPWRFQG